MISFPYKLLALVLTSVLGAGATAGEFYQLDSGPASTTAVAVKAWDDIKVSVSHSRWRKEGYATAIAITKLLPLELPGDTQLAWGLQGIDHRSALDSVQPSASGIGLKLSAEWQPKIASGQGYFLLERASIFGSWLALAQYIPNGSPLSLEWVGVGDNRWHTGYNVALRYALTDPRWSLRLGYQLNDGRIFVGLSYNGF
jgi:hypothetical protein